MSKNPNLLLNTKDNINIKADTGSINILNAQDSNNSASLDKKVEIKLANAIEGITSQFKDISGDNTKLKIKVASGTYDEEAVKKVSTQSLGSSLNAREGNVVLNSFTDTNIVGSDIKASEAIGIKSEIGNINITNSQDTQSEDKKEKHASADINLTVQNEYVETAQAVKAAAESAKQLKQTKKDYDNYKDELSGLESKLSDLKQRYKDKEVGIDYTDIEDLSEYIDNVKSQEKYYKAAIIAATADLASKTVAVATQAAAAATSSGTLGFSGGVSLDVQGSKTNTNTNSSTAVASNLLAKDIYLSTNTDLDTSINITGSNIIAKNYMDIYTKDLNVQASQNTYKQNQDNKSINGSVSFTMYGGGGGAAGLGYGQSNSDINSTTNNNSTLLAKNMNITATNDANFIGANVRADESLYLDVGNNLNVESLRDEYSSNQKGFNVNAGIGFGSGGAAANRTPSLDVGNTSSVNAGFNVNNGTTVNKQTVLSSITADNLNVNVQGNTNLKGSLLASGNFDENGSFTDNKNLDFTTKTLTFSNLSNSSYSSNQSVGGNLNYNLESKKIVDNKEIPQQAGVSSTSYGASNSLSTNVSKTLATLGQGNITIKDTENSDDLNRLNTDTSKINKDLYSSSTGTKVDATLDTRLLTEKGREQIANEFDTVQKDWYAIYKVSDAYLSDESKEKLKDLLKGDINSISQKDKEAIKEMKASALKQGYDVDKMTKDEKINLLEKLSGGMSLTTEEKQLRDAIWVSNIPLSEDWNNMRNTQINSIVDTSVKSKSFWVAEQSWAIMTIEEKQNFLQNYNDQNRSLIGNSSFTKIEIGNIDGQGQTMARYSSPLLWSTSIKLDSTDIGNFYNTVNLINHEGSGHGYQDYAISNKNDYLSTHPAQKDDVRILELSFRGVTTPNQKTIYNYGVYLSDPAEMDAWRVGDTVQKNLINQKKGN